MLVNWENVCNPDMRGNQEFKTSSYSISPYSQREMATWDREGRFMERSVGILERCMGKEKNDRGLMKM